MKKASHKISLFFSLSVILHTGLLFLQLQEDATVTRTPGITSIHIRIINNDNNSHTARNVTENLREPNIKNIYKKYSPTRIAQIESKSDNQIQENARKKIEEITQLERNHLLGQINSILSRYLTYPTLARKRGWEGTVTVYVRSISRGKLEGIQLIKSSGYDVLDRSAIKALHQIKHIEIQEWISDNGIGLQFPIVYKLTGTNYGTQTL